MVNLLVKPLRTIREMCEDDTADELDLLDTIEDARADSVITPAEADAIEASATKSHRNNLSINTAWCQYAARHKETA